MSYVILFQPKKGDRRHQYDEKTYETKEAAEQQRNDYVEHSIKTIERLFEQTKLNYQERIKTVPKQFTVKEVKNGI